MLKVKCKFLGLASTSLSKDLYLVRQSPCNVSELKIGEGRNTCKHLILTSKIDPLDTDRYKRHR